MTDSPIIALAALAAWLLAVAAAVTAIYGLEQRRHARREAPRVRAVAQDIAGRHATTVRLPRPDPETGGAPDA